MKTQVGFKDVKDLHKSPYKPLLLKERPQTTEKKVTRKSDYKMPSKMRKNLDDYFEKKLA